MRSPHVSRVRRVVLLCPYTEVPYRWYCVLPVRYWLELLGPVVPWVRKAQAGQINDEAGLAAYEPSYMHLPLSACVELDALADRVWSDVAAVKQPLMFVYSTADSVSSPACMRARAASLAAGDGDRILVLTRSEHVILYDYEAQEVIDAVLDFVCDDQETP